MRNPMIAVVMLAMALSAPLAQADSCPTWFQQGDDPWGVAAGSASYLGVDTRDVTADRLGALKLKDETGVEIVAVDQDAPAGKAGLKEKDVILTFNSQKVDSVEQLRRMIREVPPGRQVTLGISRDGQAMNVPVALGDRKLALKYKYKGNKHAHAMPVPPVPPMAMPEIDMPSFNVIVQSSARNGLMVESLTPQLAEFFGVKGGGGGVLVRSVEKGSAADTAGLRAGDVIVRVDKETIGDIGDWRRAVRNRAGASQVVIIRDKREQTMPMTFPERKSRETGAVIIGDDFDVALDLDDLKVELERIRPEIERQTREISLTLEKELSASRIEIEKAVSESRKQVEKAMKAHQKAWEKARRELEKAEREPERE